MRLAFCLALAWCALVPNLVWSQSTAPQWDPAASAKPIAPALSGYCLVSLRDHQQWQPGEEKFSVFFDGRRYQFASARERDIFAVSPEVYAPMLGGDCPVTWAEMGVRTAGRLEYGVLHGGRIIFFASDDNRRYFLEDPAPFSDVDLALGGRCIVSRRELGKDVAGIPETVAMYRGLRHLFASAHHRALFLEQPTRYDGSDSVADTGRASVPPAAAPREGIVATATPWAHPKAPGDVAASGSQQQDVVLGALPSMSGYCPVTLNRDGTWVRGRYEYRVALGDFVFLTAGPKERDALADAPEKYVPVLGGDCPVAFVTREERARGSAYHAYEYEGRLYLFADAERKALFKASPAGYATADLAAEGLCTVSQIDQGQRIMGHAEHATWYAGKLYRFAGSAEKQKFLAEPEKYREQ